MTDKYTFDLSEGMRLKIAANPLMTMLSFRQTAPHDLESGGILIGRVLEESSNLVIDCVSVPMAGDIQARSRYIRRANTHQKIFNEYWEECGGRCFYLGEWHTHPERFPTPSSVDINNWKRIVKADAQDIHSLYFIIIGTERVSLWECTNSIRKVKIILLGSIELRNWRIENG